MSDIRHGLRDQAAGEAGKGKGNAREEQSSSLYGFTDSTQSPVPSSSSSTWELVRNAVSGPAPDLLDQNLHFEKVPRPFCTVKSEKHSQMFLWYS